MSTQSASRIRSRRANRRAKTLISLTPLIDCVFILLVFFMLASSFLDWHVITLEGAEPATGAAAPGMQGAILIDMEPGGGLRLSGRPLDADSLLGELTALLARRPEAEVILRPASGVPVQAVVDLIDLLTAEGIDAVSLQRGC